MKKYLRVFISLNILIFIVTLYSCSKKSKDLITKKKDLIVVDIAPEYVFTKTKLPIYEYRNEPHISYVSVTEFIDFIDEGIIDVSVNITEEMIISFELEEYQAYYEMTIDAHNDVVSFNDINMLANLNAEILTEYETELTLSDIEVYEQDPAVEIDLSLYNFDIVTYDDEYYLPLFLANLFLTGDFINIYETDDYLYILDNFTDINDLVVKYKAGKDKAIKDISIYTKNYLALYFDYFYGLKGYKKIDTYLTELDEYDFENKNSYLSLHRELERFINEHDDLHTTIVTSGYMNDSFYPTLNSNDKYINYVRAYLNNQCNVREEEVTYQNYEDLIVVEINAFSLDTKSLLVDVMKKANAYDNIIIDVGCNGGGNVVAVIELLSYLTNKEIPIAYINPLTGSKIIEYYKGTNKALVNKNIYVFSTAATFSAANLFTSIVKDLDLAVILGEKSSGGASAITYTVLPDGAIIINSSNMTFVNHDNNIIEGGIEVDIPYQYPVNWSNILNYIK
jgi:hypothetical protein